MRITLASLVFALGGLSISTAIADPKPPADPAKMVTDDCARATKLKKQCVMNMESEHVGGETVGSTSVGVGLITFGQATSLIRVRRDFITEILKTAEDL